MPVARGSVTDERLQLRPLQIARHDFALGERPRRGRVTDFATQFDARDRGVDVVGVGQRVGVDLDGIELVATGQPDFAAAFRLNETTEEVPSRRRGIQASGVLGAG